MNLTKQVTYQDAIKAAAELATEPGDISGFALLIGRLWGVDADIVYGIIEYVKRHGGFGGIDPDTSDIPEVDKEWFQEATLKGVCKHCGKSIHFNKETRKWVTHKNDWHCGNDPHFPVKSHYPKEETGDATRV